jgi:hypothetical protein
MGIKTIGTELANSSFNLLYGFILAIQMLFNYYTIGSFIKAKLQARKRIQLPITTQEVQGDMVSALPCSNHITYRFGKGMTHKAYRLDLGSMVILMDNHAKYVI